MSWRDEPATIAQKLAIRNALDKRYGNRQAREIFDEMDVESMTKGQASDELKRIYELK